MKSRSEKTSISISMILVPLAVMLFLTVLSGLNAFYLTKAWEDASDKISMQMTETVILNNIHWHLSQIRIQDPKETETLGNEWRIVQKQLELLERDPAFDGNNPNIRSLQVLHNNLFKNGRVNQALVDSILQQDVFNTQLHRAKNNLETLQQKTQGLITSITGTLVFLGLILMSITAWDLIRLFLALRSANELNVQTQEEERRRIARDLHDGVVQEMIDLKRHYSADKVTQIIDSLRRVCHNLNPQILDDLGLTAAIGFLADDLKQFGIQNVELVLDQSELDQLPKSYELALFRILQELCTNIKHHANASRVQIHLVFNPAESHWLNVHVKDNGKGFDSAHFISGSDQDNARPSSASFMSSMGIKSIQARVAQFNGTLGIQSEPLSSTRIPNTWVTQVQIQLLIQQPKRKRQSEIFRHA